MVSDISWTLTNRFTRSWTEPLAVAVNIKELLETMFLIDTLGRLEKLPSTSWHWLTSIWSAEVETLGLKTIFRPVYILSLAENLVSWPVSSGCSFDNFFYVHNAVANCQTQRSVANWRLSSCCSSRVLPPLRSGYKTCGAGLLLPYISTHRISNTNTRYCSPLLSHDIFFRQQVVWEWERTNL